VRRRAEPVVRALSFDGAQLARPAPLRSRRLIESRVVIAGIVLCPSNPWLSVDPISSAVAS